MDSVPYLQRTHSGRLVVLRSFDNIPVKTEIEKIDDELMFFFPDGSVYVFIQESSADEYGYLVEINVH